MLTSNFRDAVLLDPISSGADHLKIVSGYAAHTMASWHMGEIHDRFGRHIEAPIDITLLVGMCGYDGLSLPVHDGFQQLMNESSKSDEVRFTAQYVYRGVPVHSKLYLWERGEQPILAYIGSPNYTQTAFSSRQREILTEFDPYEALEYFDSIESGSIYCNHAEVSEYIVLHSAHRARPEATGAVSRLRGADIHSVTLSFITESGETGQRSGINWGQRAGREPNQAYIPLPAYIARSGFFPLEKRHFSVLTDDRKQLILRVEQQNDKAITTPANNSLLGEYFRNRLGMPNGAYVRKADFERYGRTDVTFYKLDDEQFFMDFSV